MTHLGDPLTKQIMREEMRAQHGPRRIRWRNVWPGLVELVAGLVSDGCRWVWRHSVWVLVAGAGLLVVRVLVDVLPFWAVVLAMAVAGWALVVYACCRVGGEADAHLADWPPYPVLHRGDAVVVEVDGTETLMRVITHGGVPELRPVLWGGR